MGNRHNYNYVNVTSTFGEGAMQVESGDSVFNNCQSSTTKNV